MNRRNKRHPCERDESRIEGARDNLKAHGIELVALYTRDDFAD